MTGMVYPYGGRPPRKRPSSWVCAAIAVRTRILIGFRPPFETVWMLGAGTGTGRGHRMCTGHARRS
jgi:hypothetical protein